MKNRLRAEMKERLAEMPPRQRNDKSIAACKLLVSLPEFRRAASMMVYLPMPQEIDCSEAALEAWREGKSVLAPRVDWKGRHLVPVEMRSLEDGIVTGRHGLREPAEGPAWPVGRIDLVIVPALAFDVTGARLGRGGGFYDRFLRQDGLRAVACGMAFREQVVDRLPAEGHDRTVDILVTDQQVVRFDPRPLPAGAPETYIKDGNGGKK